MESDLSDCSIKAFLLLRTNGQHSASLDLSRICFPYFKPGSLAHQWSEDALYPFFLAISTIVFSEFCLAYLKLLKVAL
ncbi:MAG: hypothetical protein ACE5JX_12295 [Acidobacteriota bacterium]